MRWLANITLIAALGTLPLLTAGCNTKPAAKPNAKGHDHDHHHHDHDLGPHDGHLLELGDHEYYAEWTHDDNSGKVAIYLLDKNKKEVAAAVEEATITTKVKNDEQKYTLEAVNATSGDKPAGAKFEIVDKPLVETLLTVGEGIEAKLDLTIEGKPYTAKFEAHDDHDHGHKH